MLEHVRREGPGEECLDLIPRVREARWIRSVIAVGECGSTNDLARQAAEDGPEPVLVVAATQTAGRGRRGAHWSDARGAAVLMSLAWRPAECSVDAAPLFAIAGACAAALVARDLGVAASVKWPNDIWVGERKAGGVLAEMVVAGDSITLAVVGIGLNVTSSPAPEELDPNAVRATSLAESGWASEETPRAIAGAISAQFGAFLDAALRPVPSAVIAAAEEHGALRDRAVEVRTPSGTLRGRVLGLSAAGGLVVETEDAVRVTVTDSSATVRLI